ncbi:hypothetical protein EBS43_10655 [bacterium]|nr:hypothetical protein [bacterium]
MSETLVKTIKRDYAYLSDSSDTQTVLAQIQGWFKGYNKNAPHCGAECAVSK